jgi:O-antigen/teichoic acid export membrane protein
LRYCFSTTGASGPKATRVVVSPGSERAAIFRTALPLGLVLMLISLNTNLPRYVIEHRLGTRELGAFAAVASFMAAGTTIVNALGQAAHPGWREYFPGAG